MAVNNINEIARLAGVSNATVSRYLNGGSISQKKKDIIQKVIEETGYVPSNSARSMRTGKSNYVGVIVPKINSESVSRMVAGINEILEPQGYEVILGTTDNNPEKELKYLDTFSYRGLDGIILLGTVLTETHKKKIKESRIPVVVLGQKTEECSCVYFNDRQAAKELTGILLKSISKKKKVLGFIGVIMEDVAVGLERSEGVKEAMLEAGMNPEERVDHLGAGFSVNAGYEGMKALLEKNPDVNAVFCATDSLGAGANMYLQDVGIQVPETICMTGVGHNVRSDIMMPRLTTAEYYYKISGNTAAEILLDEMKYGKEMKQHTMLGYKILKRGSTAD